MTNQEMASSYRAQARSILREAEAHMADGEWNLVVRRCQEAVEMALKAALRAGGIEVPAMHDVGPILRRSRDKFPPDFAAEVDRLASASRRLWHEREPSMYGDEETGTPPTDLYVEADARDALASAKGVVAACEALMETGWGGPGSRKG